MVSLVGAVASGAPAHQDHRKVDKLPTPVEPESRARRGEIEIVEYFWYGSPHTNRLEPSLAVWAASLPSGVVFRREHVLWGPRPDIETHARLFATLRAMGIDEAQRRDIFASYHDRGDRLANDEAVFAWVAKRGIDRAKFTVIYRSAKVAAQMAYAQDLTGYFEIQTVPTFVINRKHVIAAYNAAGEDGVLAQVDAQIALERARLRQAKATRTKRP